ncbi:MAG: polysaccharide biosynthesis protein [Paludibacteraceae bacterium]|nr:polysaccharide biosynthesis protein [Paludibacteraceae bacterium]
MDNFKNKIKSSNIFAYLSSIGYLPRWMVLLVDVVLCIVAYFCAFQLAYHYYYFQYASVQLYEIKNIIITLGCQILWFWVFHTYSGILRYSTFIDATKLLYAIIANASTLITIHYLVLLAIGKGVFLRLGIVLYAIFAFLLLFSLRLVVKTLYDTLVIRAGRAISVVVYGTKSAGISIAKMIRSDVNSHYRVDGFIDDRSNQNKQIFGLPIFSTKSKDIISNLQKKRIKAIVVSPLKLNDVNITKSLNCFIDAGFQILMIPSLRHYKEGDDISGFDIEKNLKKIQIEDLLGRKPIEIDKSPIEKMIAGKVILITGAAGSIGSEIVRQLSMFKPKKLILLDNAETPLHNIRLELTEKFHNIEYAFVIADVRMRDRIESVFSEMRPNVVFHAAAYKHVPLMEDNPAECVLANVLGSRNVADMAVKYGTESFVMVSTDKAVNPTNVMGCSKRIAEIYVQSLSKKLANQSGKAPRFITTRFGNVLGSNGSVIPLFRQQIEKGGPVTVTHPDIIRYFMTIPEACQLVLEAGTIGNGGEIFIFDMGMPVKIADLAKKMIRLSGLEPGVDIQIEYTGLRPGEKLYEELLNNEELVKPTSHDKIMIANVREYEYDEMLPMYDKLFEYAQENQNYLVVRTMKEMVPEYKSQNSVYQQIDSELKNNYL